MVSVRLPDGHVRELSPGASAADLAADISLGLAKNAVAARVDGEVVDLARALPEGVEVAILTKKDTDALEVLRHSAAHLMADAILAGLSGRSADHRPGGGRWLLLRYLPARCPHQSR